MENRIHLLFSLSGVLCEAFIFSRGEWDRRSPQILKIAAYLQLFVVCFLLGSGSSLTASAVDTLRLTFSFLTGVLGAMMIYRLLFHPLQHFPGPFAARLSSLWAFKQNIPDLKFYVKLRKLHDTYGDFVRIRPRELSICHPDAILDVHGPRSKVRKGEFYDQMMPHQNLQLTRDPALHHRKRRGWDRMFSTKALHEYEPRLLKHYSILMRILSEKCAAQTAVNVEKVFMDLFFDVVSDLIFGKSWDMLPSGIPNPVIEAFNKSKKVIGFMLLEMPFFHLIKSIPFVEKKLEEAQQYYVEQLANRKKMLDISNDFYTHLSQSDGFEHEAAFDAQLAVIAGADTVAVTLTNICYFLARDPQVQKKLHQELDTLFAPDQDHASDQLLAGKPYLHGVINEALRLYPPVPSGVQRLTPPEGATIAGRYIPGDMIVTTPTWSIHRDKRAFVRPDEFIPERWSSQPELILRKDAFIPFSYGPYNCTGRPLAMMQLRMVLAMIVRKFEISFAPGKEAICEKYIHDQADCFVVDIGELPLSLRERSHS